MGRKRVAILVAILLLVGLGIMLYPILSSTINGLNGSYAIQKLEHQLDNMDILQRESELAAARAYNEKLRSLATAPEELEEYNSILDFGNGIMGYIEIPSINVRLPIYHGVATEVLEKGVGHLPTSGFPIGGEGNHGVLTGHTGLPSASLFTDLEKVGEGDRFEITVAGETVTYQVDQIRVVLPNETGNLVAVDGEDYCTLVTCTPYGVNSHRLLVRGSRVAVVEEVPVIRIEPEKKEEEGRKWLWLILPVLGCSVFSSIRKRRKDD